MASKKKKKGKISASAASKSYNQKTLAKMKARDAGGSNDPKVLADNLAGLTQTAKGLGIDTARSNAMVAQTKEQGSKQFTGSSSDKGQVDTPGANTSGYTDLKSMSIGLAQGQTPTQQTPEEIAQSAMSTMTNNNPDTSGVGTQSTQGDANAGTQENMDPSLLPGQVTPGGTLMTGGTPMATVAIGGYQKIGPAYFQKTSDGMSAVTDPTVISGLKHGTIPFSTGQLDGTTFSSHSVPLVATGATTQKNKVKNALGFTSTTDGVDENADIGTTYQSQKNKYGLTQTQTDLWSDPQKTITDMTKSIYKMSGMEDANDAIKDITSDLEDLENKRDDEIGDINDNPWLTEGVRLRQIASVESRYEDKIANHTNKLRLLEDVRNNAQQQAQFAIGTAISLWDKERTFQQNQIDSWNEQAQREIDNDFKMKDYNLKLSQLGKTSDINNYLKAKETGFEGGFYEYMHPEKSGETSDWQMFNAGDGSTVMYNQRTGARIPVSGGPGSTQQTKDLAVVNDISNLLTDPGFDSTFGLTNIANRNIPGTPAYNIKQNVDNLISELALGARSLLKGQGAVSDFEGRLLQRAQTSLTLNMNPAQARYELTQVRGVIQTATGGSATVRITSPNGQSKVGEADQAMITEAIANGYRVQYE